MQYLTTLTRFLTVYIAFKTTLWGVGQVTRLKGLG